MGRRTGPKDKDDRVLSRGDRDPSEIFALPLTNYIFAFVRPLKKRATMAILAYRVRAKNPTLTAHPTSIWDYGYHDLHAIEIGKDVVVAAYSFIIVFHNSPNSSIPGRLILEDRSAVSFGVNIRAAGGTIRLGVGSAVAANCVLIAANHMIKPGEPKFKVKWDESRSGVDIGSNVWVGAGCVLLPGTVIGDDSVIAAGSVVRGTVPAGEIWGGVPARKLKAIGQEKVEQLERISSALPFGE